MYGNVGYDTEEQRSRIFYHNQRRLTVIVVCLLLFADLLTTGFLPLFFFRASTTHSTAWLWAMIVVWAVAFSLLVTMSKIILEPSLVRNVLFGLEVATGALSFFFLIIVQTHRTLFIPFVCVASVFIVLTQWTTVLAVKDMCVSYRRVRG